MTKKRPTAKPKKLKLSLRTLHSIDGLETLFNEELAGLLADAASRQRHAGRRLRLEIYFHGERRGGSETGDLTVGFSVKVKRPYPRTIDQPVGGFTCTLDGDVLNAQSGESAS